MLRIFHCRAPHICGALCSRLWDRIGIRRNGSLLTTEKKTETCSTYSGLRPRRILHMASANVVPNQDSVVCETDIAAPPERVFAALTDPQQLLLWWGKEPS